MKSLHFACICGAVLLAIATAAFAADPTPASTELPAPWKQMDLGLAEMGAPKPLPASPAATRPLPRASVPGSGSVKDGVFQIQGTMDLWGLADGCHFIYQSAEGDLELIARVAAFENPGGV